MYTSIIETRSGVARRWEKKEKPTQADGLTLHDKQDMTEDGFDSFSEISPGLLAAESFFVGHAQKLEILLTIFEFML